MDVLAKIFLGKLIEILVKKAEEKFIEAKAGADKKAYVINKVDAIVDLNKVECEKTKEEIINFTSEKIEEKVNSLFKK